MADQVSGTETSVVIQLKVRGQESRLRRIHPITGATIAYSRSYARELEVVRRGFAYVVSIMIVLVWVPSATYLADSCDKAFKR